MENLDFTNYDRITDTIMYLSDDVWLNFTVALSRKNKNGDRVFYHSETLYGSDKYGTKLRSIKRSMNFYFVLDVKPDFNAGMILRPQDVEILSRLIESKILPWYFGNDNEVAFQIIGDNLVLRSFEPVTYVQNSIYGDKYLSFEPIVATENDLEIRGCRVSISTGYSFVLTIDKFMGFYSLIKNTDMYVVATSLATYAKVPPYGINTYNMQGLGAMPPSSMNKWNGFNSNSFLENSKSKKEGE